MSLCLGIETVYLQVCKNQWAWLSPRCFHSIAAKRTHYFWSIYFFLPESSTSCFDNESWHLWKARIAFADVVVIRKNKTMHINKTWCIKRYLRMWSSWIYLLMKDFVASQTGAREFYRKQETDSQINISIKLPNNIFMQCPKESLKDFNLLMLRREIQLKLEINSQMQIM